MPDSPEEKTGPAPKPVDPASFLLPKKEGAPSVDSAQRVNAAALLQQESSATLLTPEGKAQPAGPAPAKTPEAPAQPPKPDAGVASLETYQGDIQKVVTDRGVSVVSIAAAEADRAGKKHEAPAAVVKKNILAFAATLGGGALLLAASALIVYMVTRPSSVPVPQAPQSPFISVDDTALVPIAADESRVTLMDKLSAARDGVNLPVGLVERLYLSRDPSGSAPLSAQEFFGILLPNAPAQLTRTLSGEYLLGVHSYDENQVFLLFSVDSYETAYAGMLAWEASMYSDLSPLFVRTPALQVQDTSAATPAATSTGSGQASSTQGTLPQQFLPTDFVDKIVENRDTRAIVDPAGNILLLWTFLGRDTVLITTNEHTLQQVLSTLLSAPTIPQP